MVAGFNFLVMSRSSSCKQHNFQGFLVLLFLGIGDVNVFI